MAIPDSQYWTKDPRLARGKGDMKRVLEVAALSTLPAQALYHQMHNELADSWE
jgi:hypothetical protein